MRERRWLSQSSNRW